MYSIGIDIAKYAHSVAVLGKGGEILVNEFEFANTAEGYKALLNRLSSKDIGPDSSEVCLEATGHYGRALISHLRESGFTVFEVNPILTHNWRKAMSVRKVKNDRVDALALAQWLYLGNPAKKTMLQEHDELKTLARSRTFLSHIIGDAKRRAIAILDQVFPEYARCFSDTFGLTSLAVLKRWPSAYAISLARIDALSKCMSKASGGKLGRYKAEKLKALAKSSFGLGQESEGKAFHLLQLLAQIEFTKSQMAALDLELARLVAHAGTFITTIPGIGAVCAAVILGEIGDITRFDSPSKLVAFSGYDPSVFESGEFTGTRNRISKRGSAYLRWTLWLAADRARRFDPVLKEYYEKKRAEGKCHKVAICAITRKLCNIIFAVLRDNKPYAVPIR